ncbi:hypothetical protein EK599_13740 [Vibrio sp. T187]|mgnify:CR=1 FL=1|uniref:sulfotransferase domain-containing protein n=1 Tax=Vibrio TaxID=662 RepID=UPI0010CA1BF7|nr:MULTISPECIES: sulfotransferase domain-containing protein [Vibrio]MBW3696756.1 hypothetical protein [Vibrio sp. T187]
MTKGNNGPVIIVSLHKSGTNLVTKLLENMGYDCFGSGIKHSYEGIYQDLKANKHLSMFDAYQEDPSSILAESDKLYELTKYRLDNKKCLVLHSLNKETYERIVSELDVEIIFNYRDPRAVLVSFVNYLSSKAKEDFTQVSGYIELSSILKRLPTMEQRLSFVITKIPNYITGVFQSNAWLLDQPNILKITYEDLVGDQGGGCEQKQHLTIKSIISVLQEEHRVDDLAESLYSTQSRTFQRGKANAWGGDFTPELTALFNNKYLPVLEQYGYE